MIEEAVMTLLWKSVSSGIHSADAMADRQAQESAQWDEREALLSESLRIWK